MSHINQNLIDNLALIKLSLEKVEQLKHEDLFSNNSKELMKSAAESTSEVMDIIDELDVKKIMVEHKIHNTIPKLEKELKKLSTELKKIESFEAKMENALVSLKANSETFIEELESGSLPGNFIVECITSELELLDREARMDRLHLSDVEEDLDSSDKLIKRLNEYFKKEE